MKEKHNYSWKNFLVLTIAGVVNAFGVTVFLFPVKLYDSGFSGLSMLLDQVTPPFLILPLFLLLLDLPVFFIGMKRQGSVFTVYSAYSVLIYAIMSFLITKVLPIDVSFASPLAGSDLLLCALFGGTVSGIGSGLAIRCGGAIDGIDVLAVLFAKRLNLSIGNFVLIFNLILYVICGIVINSWILPLYSIVTYFAGSKTVDFIVDGLDRSKCAMIVTTNPDAVIAALSAEFGSSGTLVNAVGGYSGEEKAILYFVVNHFQINKLKQLVRQNDAAAFISVLDVSEVIRR